MSIILHFNNAFKQDYINLGPYDESNCYAMGWGPKSRFSKNATELVQQHLRDVRLPIIQNDECETLLQTSKNEQGQFLLGPNFKLHKSFNCAGYKLYFFIYLKIDYYNSVYFQY